MTPIDPASDAAFTGSIPGLYETILVPLMFAPYATDLAGRLAAHRPLANVLEIAAGTGAVTRALAAALPARVTITASDLNPAMLDLATRIGTERPVEWRVADAMQLPFDDASVDAVVCQFGVMFFPDRPAAFAEVRRVLRPGGVFLFNAWDSVEHNEFAQVAAATVAGLFPEDPPHFIERTPHGYHDPALIERDLHAAGFDMPPTIERLTARSKASSARNAAVGFCQGTPLRNEIETRDKGRLAEATDAVERAMAERFGRGAIEGKIQAWVVSARKGPLPEH